MNSEPLFLLGVPVHPVDIREIHDEIERAVSKGEKSMILNVNVHAMNLALKHNWLKEDFNKAALVFCDGDGVRLGFKLRGKTPPPKVTYDRWMWELADFCQAKGYSLYFLGAKPGVAEEAARKLRERSTDLKIVGTHHGYFNHEGPETEERIAEINRLKPDILLVGFGMPLQERWLHNHAHKIEAHVFLTGGAAFECISGSLTSPPKWMVSMHLEWLYRWYQQPLRRFRRYFFGIPSFLIRVLCER